MNKTQEKSRILWQHPYVNVFKQFKVESWKRSSKEGDVTSVMDKQLKSTVYRILGSIPAGNYIQIPRASTQSLGLTGRYFYLLFKPTPTRYFVVHIDTAAEDGLVVRISFSNLFKEFKCTSTWLQFPFACRAAKGSVEHQASTGAKNDIIGPTPLAQRWTMLVLDIQYILSVYINRKYSHIKNVRICANQVVKNCFTSDIEYDPRISFRKARELGIKSVDENLAPMPRDMNFFIPKNKSWDDLYDLVRFPTSPGAVSASKPSLLPFDSIQRDDHFMSREDQEQAQQIGKAYRIGSRPPGVMHSPRREEGKVVDVGRNVSAYTTAQHTVSVATHSKKQPTGRLPIVSELPPVGLSMFDSTVSSEPKDVTLVESGTGDVHIFADSVNNRDMVVHRHYSRSKKSSKLPSTASIVPKTKSATIRSSARSEPHDNGRRTTPRSARSTGSSGFRVGASPDRPLSDMTCLDPDPILKLRRIIGFACGVGSKVNSCAYRHKALWHPGSNLGGGNEVIVYAVHAVIIAMEVANGHQHFFVGHTDSVVALAFNSCTGITKSAASTSLLASAQKGDGGVVRVWHFDTRKCAAIVKSQQASSMNILSFSRSGAILVGCGRDMHNKMLIVVWDTSGVLRHGSVSVIARARTDVQIVRLQICPADDTRLVTCGKDNIRFWRVRSGQLRSCPVALSDHKIGEVTDVTFETAGKVSEKNQSLSVTENKLSTSVYACTKAGYIIEIDFHDVNVKAMHHLLPTQEENGESLQKGICLNAIKFSESYLATGSDDGFLRLWPLDLTTVFLEAKHEGPIMDLDLTPDGMKVLASTSAGTLGYLDVATRQYTTAMRSHTDKIQDCCIDGLRRTITTCSEDGSIRVWDLATLRQLYDFTTPNDTPVTISCHPLLEIFACGFESGAVRVFHVGATSLLSEHSVHSTKVTGVIFAPSGEFLYSSEINGTVALYDTSDIERSGSAIIRALPRATARGDRYGPRSIAVSHDSQKVAFVGPTEYTVTVAAAATLDELLRIDVSTGLNLEPDILKQKPTVDCPLRVCFSSAKSNRLLVVTTGNRLLKLNLKDGCLLSITENIQRNKTTSITVTDDNKHFATAGDGVVKVWDYELKKDINFQVFIGHCGTIRRILFTPDQLSLVSCGEDGVFLWDFLAGGHASAGHGLTDQIPGRGRSEVEENFNILSVGRKHREDLLTSARLNHEDSEVELPTRDVGPGITTAAPEESTPQPRRAIPMPTGPAVSRIVGSPLKTENSGWVPPDTLRTVDLDATDVSEFTVDAQMMQQLLLRDQQSKQTGHMTAHTGTTKDGEIQKDPVRVTWGVSTIRGRNALSSKNKKQTEPAAEKTKEIMNGTKEHMGFPDRPSVLKHFSARDNASAQAVRRYAPQQGEEGLRLESVIGYNGNGRGNFVWNPDTGIFAYSSGCIVVLEHLETGEQKHLMGHSEEISTIAMQHDGQILACASCEKGLVPSEIGLWNVETGECHAYLRHHDHDVVVMAYSRDDRFLVSVGDYRDNSVILWSAYNGETRPVVLATSRYAHPIHHIAWDPTAPNEFVTVGHETSIVFWMLEEYGAETQLKFHAGEIPRNMLDQNDELSVHLTSACFGSDHILYVGSNSGIISAWNTQTNQCFLHWKADTAEICTIVSRGARLIAAGASRNVRLWSLTSVQEARRDNCDDAIHPDGLVLEDELSLNAEITSAVFDDTLDIGIVGTTAGTLWYVDWNEHTTVKMVAGHGSKITGIAFDDEEYFATSSEEGSVRLWSTKSCELTVQFQVLDQPCICVTFSNPLEENDPTDSQTPKLHPPSRKMVAAGYGDGTLRIFDVVKLALMLKLQPHSTKVTSVAFSSNNCILLSGAWDGRIAVTSLATGITLRMLDDQRGTPINQIAVSLRKDHPASILARAGGKTSHSGWGSDSIPDWLDSSVWLAVGADRRVSVWVSIWEKDKCDMVDWLTFPAPCFAPDGTETSKRDKNALSLLPPSSCIFHPSNPDYLVYAGYGMEKFIQLYSLAKQKVVKSFAIPSWSLCLDASTLADTGSDKAQLLAIGTSSRLVELIDACHGTFQDFIGHSGPVEHVKFSPNGRILLTASGTELLVWKVLDSTS